MTALSSAAPTVSLRKRLSAHRFCSKSRHYIRKAFQHTRTQSKKHSACGIAKGVLKRRVRLAMTVCARQHPTTKARHCYKQLGKYKAQLQAGVRVVCAKKK